ncbi:putative nucleotidyltransferase with HDIG domain [Chitinivorax tropicus]|uniref:Putative nucleotidyltransferase with HDIG domain n=1 Tax=Chitinivorax tropicus TaxID=714531 RepID=A0A840MHH0_9PROT|nr:HD-GYP domain-containing protein [Chitinivorax tropicus]MBB5018664.1 putative nucleotidyltransferase with HDIG domain [Chitinivorax tropicus]
MTSDHTMADNPNAEYITPDQLCAGLYIHLDLGWMDHPFPLGSFKIKNGEQIATIQSLGLSRIRFDPKKSDTKPLPRQAQSAPAQVAPLAIQDNPAILAKRARLEKLNQQRAAIAECEKKFHRAATAIKNITKNLFARPAEALKEASTLVEGMVDSLLLDREIAIHLMNDKVAGEEVYFHSLNVAVLAMMLAKEINMPAEDIRELGMGAMFHDIGKVEIPDKILLKSDPLSFVEQELFNQHTVFGLKIAAKVGLSKRAAEVVLQHHEYIDGTGYPGHLQGDQISPLAKLLAIVNLYDNLCNCPNPANSLTPHEALSQLFAQHRNHFDTTMMKTFIRCLGVYPPGSVVKLSNDVIGMIVSVNSANPLKPCAVVFDPNVPKTEAIIVDLAQESDLSIVASIRPGQLPRPIYDYLSPRKRVNYYFDSASGNTKPS